MTHVMTIELRVDESGKESVHVAGPLANKTLCYGMLERARDALQAFDPANGAGLVVPQNGSRILS